MTGRKATGSGSAASNLALLCEERAKSLRAHAFAEIFDRGFGSALAMGDIERIERDFDHSRRAQNNRGVDLAHMADPERLALEVPDPGAEYHAPLFFALALQRGRSSPVHRCRRDVVRA